MQQTNAAYITRAFAVLSLGLVRSLCAIELGVTAPVRRWGVCLGGGMLAYWIALIPFAAQVYPLMIVARSILTVAVSLILENQLARAELRARGTTRPVNPPLQPQSAEDVAIAGAGQAASY
jgi:ABC-type antimicrobial peptide transport system permease subunit